MSELPESWTTAAIDDVCLINPKSQHSMLPNDLASFVPMAAVDEVSGEITGASERPYSTVARGFTQFQQGDVLLAKITPCMENGKCAVVRTLKSPVGYGSTEFYVLRSRGALNSDLLWRFLRQASFRADAEAVMTGAVGQRRVPVDYLRRHEIPLPPLPEQRRIVAKLDSLTARTARARAQLERVPTLVEHYRDAILRAAFNGELTSDWRSEHRSVASAKPLVQALESLRVKLATQAKVPRSGPISDGESGRHAVELDQVPSQWRVLTLEAVTSPIRLIQYGILKPGPDLAGGVPYVKVMNIKGGVVELGKIRRTSQQIHEQYRRSAIRSGDILLSIRGTVGRLAIVPPELDGGNITQDSVRIDVLKPVAARYVYWYLHSPMAQQYFDRNQKGVAVRGINVGDVRPMEIPIPSEQEQAEIVDRIDTAFGWLDKVEKEHTSALRLLAHLDQGILSRALRGELVRQDPSDEPASVLLDRIKAAQDGASGTTRRRRNVRSDTDADSPPMWEAAEPKPRAYVAEKAHPAPRAEPAGAVEIDRDDLICLIRRVFSTGGAHERQEAIRELAQDRGAQRVGSRIREELENGVRTAVRRGILEASGTELRLAARMIDDYDRDFLKLQFLASLQGRAWTEREDAAVQFARWMGYGRTGAAIEDKVRSLIHGLLKEGRLEADGTRIRKA